MTLKIKSFEQPNYHVKKEKYPFDTTIKKNIYPTVTLVKVSILVKKCEVMWS